MRNMRFSILVLGLFLALVLCHCSGKIKQFSEANPYAVELARARSYYHAQKIESRLKSMDVPTYMVLLADDMDESSRWYVLLTGAEKDTLSAAKLTVELEIQQQLKKLKILNYNQISQYLLPLERKKIDEIENIEAFDPDLPSNIYELLEKFPQSDAFNVEHVSLFNFSVPQRYLQNYYNTSLDLPRGISKNLLAQKAEAFAEVIYKDNLYGDQVTVDVVKLSKTHGITDLPRTRLVNQTGQEDEVHADHVAWFFAALILNTGKYITEEYEKIVVNSYTVLYGYKVVIEPKKGQVRTYMILVDAVGGFVIFSQSTQKSDKELLDYLTSFGKSKGMLDYSEFHNTFYTIPRCLEEGDLFVGYSSEILTNAYARSKGYEDWARAMVGHPVSSSYFYNQILRLEWSCSAFDLLTRNKKDYIYNDMYRNKNYSGRKEVKVNDSDGFYIQDWYSREVNFSSSGRHVFTVNSTRMAQEAMLLRARKLQTGRVTPGQDPCEEKKPDDGIVDAGGDRENETQPALEEPSMPNPKPEKPPKSKPEPSSAGASKNTPSCGEGQILTRYDSTHANYKSFQLETELTSFGSNMTSAEVYDLMLQQGGYIVPSNDSKPVTDCRAFYMSFTAHKDNPVLVKLTPESYTITIYSTPGHVLHPSQCIRRVEKRKGKLYIVTIGQTLSPHPAAAEWRSPLFWKKADDKWMKMKGS